MGNKELKSFSIIVLIILISYVIPYTIFTNLDRWYGSFLLWTLVGVATIMTNIIITKDWEG